MNVETDHQIVAFGADQMHLFDNQSSTVIVVAQRNPDGWVVSADGHDDVRPEPPGELPPRRKVIEAMVAMALEISPQDGYSTLVPHGLEDTP